jgi:hypothetical protein
MPRPWRRASFYGSILSLGRISSITPDSLLVAGQLPAQGLIGSQRFLEFFPDRFLK